jgi:hypothetical protein
MSIDEFSRGEQVSNLGILSILFDKKGRAKPPARRGCSAYASESDIHNSSIVNLHLSFHEVLYEEGESLNPET